MYFRIINFTLLAPSLWVMINQFKNDNVKIIKIADNKGMIVETGNHNSLVNQNKIYSKLWNIQTKN